MDRALSSDQRSRLNSIIRFTRVTITSFMIWYTDSLIFVSATHVCLHCTCIGNDSTRAVNLEDLISITHHFLLLLLSFLLLASLYQPLQQGSCASARRGRAPRPSPFR